MVALPLKNDAMIDSLNKDFTTLTIFTSCTKLSSHPVADLQCGMGGPLHGPKGAGGLGK
jgi:hypothetical protein